LYVLKNDLGTFRVSIYTYKMELNNHKKVPNYECEICNYSTVRESQLKRHLSTAKHLNTYNTYINTYTKVPKLVTPYSCVCGANYKHRQSLYKHQQNCLPYNNIDEKESMVVCPDIVPVEKSEGVSNETIKEIIKQNHDIVDLLVEERKRTNDLQHQLIEATKEAKTVNNNNTINNNTVNNFNLQVFLNENCKNAINITDFIDSLHISIADLQQTGKLGYVDGISRIFVKALQNLDETERPIHCTDVKRETMYIKDENKWEKETKTGDKMKKTIQEIQNKNLNKLSDWQKENPEVTKMNTQENNEFINITLHTLGDENNKEKQDEKIIKNILKEVTIDKQTKT